VTIFRIKSLGGVFPAACGVDKINYMSDTPLLAEGSFINLSNISINKKPFCVSEVVTINKALDHQEMSDSLESCLRTVS